MQNRAAAIWSARIVLLWALAAGAAGWGADVTLLPVTESEVVIEPFYDPGLRNDALWRITADPGVVVSAPSEWRLSWERSWSRTQPGRVVLRMSRVYDLPLGNSDTLRFLLAFPETVRLQVAAVLDGERAVLIEDMQGENEFRQFDVPLGRSGAVLGTLELIFASETGDDGRIQVMSLTLVDSVIEERLKQRPSLYSADWPHILVSAAAASANPQPTLNLLFDGTDLQAIRAKVAPGQPYEKLFGKLRERARQYQQIAPEERIGRFLYLLPFHTTEALGQMHDWATPAMICSFVGLVDNDPDMLRMGARFLCAAVHSEHWTWSWHDRLTGSAWEARSFCEGMNTASIAMAWDWAGSLLTDNGHAVVRRAILLKSLPYLEYDFATHGYIRTMNQGIVLGMARIICYLAAGKRGALALDHLPQAESLFADNVNRYLLPDGGSAEGPGYFFGASPTQILVTYYLLARHQGVPFEQIAPERLRRCVDYVCAHLTTSDIPPSHLMIADGPADDSLQVDQMALFGLLGEERFGSILASLLRNPPDFLHQTPILSSGIMTIIAGPSDVPTPKTVVPEFAILPDTGMLTSCRPTESGPVRLHVVGGSANAGHCHADRGSFILEAFGDMLLIDRGIMSYLDARATGMKASAYHNLVTPVDPDGTFPDQLNPCPVATIPSGQGDETALQCSIDVTAAWGGRVRKHVRRFESSSPLETVVVDEIEFSSPTPVAFHLQSYLSFVRDGQVWRVQSKHAQLEIQPEWTVVQAKTGEEGVDYRLRPVYRLTLIAPPRPAHQFRTHVGVRPRH